jgi:hypothetical protein
VIESDLKTLVSLLQEGAIDVARAQQLLGPVDEEAQPGAGMISLAPREDTLESAELEVDDAGAVVGLYLGLAETMPLDLRPWVTSYGAPSTGVRLKPWEPTPLVFEVPGRAGIVELTLEIEGDAAPKADNQVKAVRLRRFLSE